MISRPMVEFTEEQEFSLMCFLRLHVGDIYWSLSASACLRKKKTESDVIPFADSWCVVDVLLMIN